jgi:hypothetical protein
VFFSKAQSEIEIRQNDETTAMSLILEDSSSEDEEEEVWEVVDDNKVDESLDVESSKTIQIPLGKEQQQKATKTKKPGIKKRDRIARAYSHFTHLLYVRFILTSVVFTALLLVRPLYFPVMVKN